MALPGRPLAFATLLVGGFSNISATHAQTVSPAVPVATAHQRVGEIVIDGQLREPDWGAAAESGSFTERRPVVGSTPPVDTDFRVLYDADALYFGIVCELAPDERPRAVELARDNFRIFSDDSVSVKIDVRRDRRTTLGFAVNAAGAQLDYIAIDNGAQFIVQFDSVWESAVSADEHAWYAEIRIPVAALGIPPLEGDARVMGLNVTRDHNAVRGTYDWAAMPVQLGAVAAQYYGELRGLNDLSSGRPFRAIPYLLGGYREDDPSRFVAGTPWTLSAGGDLLFRLGERTFSQITVLTDFAEVDLDSPAINLNRFALFFPERRPFFLTGLDVFEFGTSGIAQPFFTRRIGLDENRQEELMLGGLKAYGRVPVGDTSINFGLLDVITGIDQPVNHGVARLRLNLGRASYVGALTTVRYRHPNRPNVTAGADFLARMAKGKLETSGFVTGTFNETTNDEDETTIERGLAGRIAAQWNGQAFRPSAAFLWIDETFDPRMGFVRRRGITEARATLRGQHRTRRLGLEAVDVRVIGTQTLDHRLRQSLGRQARLQLDLNWISGWGFSSSIEYFEDVVQTEFELIGNTIAPGAYRGPIARFSLWRSSARNPGLELDYTADAAFFGGRRQTLSASVNLAITKYARLIVSGSPSFIDLPNVDPFVALTGSVNAFITPSPNLRLDATLQVNTVDQTLTTLARARWRYLPGSDIFLVYRERRPYGSARSDPDLQLERRLILKINYRYETLL